MNPRNVLSVVLTTCLIFALAGSASAGLLDTGSPMISGTTSFSNDDLNGTVDWAVFGPGDFPFSGYTPTPGELSYVYQVHSTGADVVSSYSVPLLNPADNIESFSDPGNGVTGIVPSAQEMTVPGAARWLFQDPGIGTGQRSEALVFSSPNIPLDVPSSVVDGGAYAVAIPVPSPSGTPIPEPATVWLLVSVLGVMLLARLRRKVAR